MFRTAPPLPPPSAPGGPPSPDAPSAAIGWGLAVATCAAGYVRVAWHSPVPEVVLVVGAGAALLWPGRYSPRGCAWALLRPVVFASPGEHAPAPALDVPAGGRRPAWAVTGGAVVVALVWAFAPAPLWVLGGLAAVVLAAVLRPLLEDPPGAGIRRADSLSDLSTGGGADGLAQWRSEVVDRWYEGVRGVPALVLREGEWEPDEDDAGTTAAAGPRRIVAVAEIVNDDVRPVPGGVAFAVDTRDAMAVTEDVAGAVGKLRRVLDADTVLVEPVPARASFSIVTAYRGQPWHGRPPVDWRTMRPARIGREVVPVGETAHADLLRADTERTAVSARPAVLSHRESLLVVSAANAGKTGLLRAYLRGLLVQGVPFLPVLIDNKGELSALAGAVRAMGGLYADDPDDYPDAVRWAWETGEARYARGAGYQHIPTLTEPLVQVVIAEWIDFVDWARTAKAMTALRSASTIPRRHRGSAVNLATTAQAGQQKELTIAREFFPQRAVMRVDNADQVDMALGDGSLARGAHAHLIPPDAQGAVWLKNRATGFPYLARAAWIPEIDQGAALIDPMTELGRRMRAARKETA